MSSTGWGFVEGVGCIFSFFLLFIFFFFPFFLSYFGVEKHAFSVCPAAPQAVIHIQCAQYIYIEREREERESAEPGLFPYGLSRLLLLELFISLASMPEQFRLPANFRHPKIHPTSFPPPPPPSPPPLSMCPVYSRQQDL
jgi:hypothetical protein